MGTHVRHPIWLPACVPPGRAPSPRSMRTESFARATVVERHSDPGLRDPAERADASRCSTRVVSLLGLSVTLFMPMLIEALCPALGLYGRVPACSALGSLFFVTHTLSGQMLGMLCTRHGRERAVDHAQPLHHGPHPQDRLHAVRIAAHGVVDARLDRRPDAGHLSLHATSASMPRMARSRSLPSILLALFWYLPAWRQSADPAGKSRAVNPLANIGRFISQPRLRLAWLIAFGRSCFWTTFFVYGPLFMVIAGRGRARRRPAGIGRQCACCSWRSSGARPASASARARQ